MYGGLHKKLVFMKRDKIIYWSTTTLAALGFLMSAFMYLSRNPELIAGFSKLGYPVYFVMLLGTAKLLGSIALLVPLPSKLKEWTYAGFTFTLVGAVWTHIATHTPFVAPLLFLLVVAASYIFYNRVKDNVMVPGGIPKHIGYKHVNQV